MCVARSPAVLLRLEELLGRLDIAAIEDRLGLDIFIPKSVY